VPPRRVAAEILRRPGDGLDGSLRLDQPGRRGLVADDDPESRLRPRIACAGWRVRELPVAVCVSDEPSRNVRERHVREAGHQRWQTRNDEFHLEQHQRPALPRTQRREGNERRPMAVGELADVETGDAHRRGGGLRHVPGARMDNDRQADRHPGRARRDRRCPSRAGAHGRIWSQRSDDVEDALVRAGPGQSRQGGGPREALPQLAVGRRPLDELRRDAVDAELAAGRRRGWTRRGHQCRCHPGRERPLGAGRAPGEDGRERERVDSLAATHMFFPPGQDHTRRG
jgi:hypothetical protein